MATKYVSTTGSNGNNGDEGTPWATITFASTQINAGDTVIVKNGTYNEGVNTAKSGTSGNRVTYRAESYHGAIINHGGTGTNNAVWFNSGSFVDIEDFEITSSASHTQGILNHGSNVRAIDCHVHHIPVPGCDSNGGAGVNISAISTAGDNHAIRCRVNDIGYGYFNINDPVCNRVHGVYYAYNSGTQGTVQNCLIYRIPGSGINLFHRPEDLVIANNTVFQCANTGVRIAAETGFTAHDIRVINNIFTDNRIGIHSQTNIGVNVTYSNNCLFDNFYVPEITENGDPVNTLTSDPLFVNYQVDGSGDYHLDPDSPCVDAGLDESGVPTTDYDGEIRPQGSGIDIGNYEQPGLPPPTVVGVPTQNQVGDAATSISLTKPTGLQINDRLYFFFGVNAAGTAHNLSDNNGGTPTIRAAGAPFANGPPGSCTQSFEVFYRDIGDPASEPASYTWNNDVAGRAWGIAVGVRGNGAQPFEDAPAYGNHYVSPGTASPVSPGITVDTDHCLVFGMVSIDGSSTTVTAAPSGGVLIATPSNFHNGAVAYFNDVAAGATGDKTWTLGSSQQCASMTLFSVKSAVTQAQAVRTKHVMDQGI